MDIEFDSAVVNIQFVLAGEEKQMPLHVPQVEKGTKFRIKTLAPFTNLNGAAVDPDRVLVGFEINNVASSKTVFTYDWGTGDPTGTIVRDGTGMYHADIDSSLYPAGSYVISVACEPTNTAHDASKTKLRQSYLFTVVDNSFSLE
jgi:hypothetical protein